MTLKHHGISFGWKIPTVMGSGSENYKAERPDRNHQKPGSNRLVEVSKYIVYISAYTQPIE